MKILVMTLGYEDEPQNAVSFRLKPEDADVLQIASQFPQTDYPLPSEWNDVDEYMILESDGSLNQTLVASIVEVFHEMEGTDVRVSA